MMTSNVPAVELARPVEYKFGHQAESSLNNSVARYDESLARAADGKRMRPDRFVRYSRNIGFYSVCLGNRSEAEGYFRRESWFRRVGFLLGSLSEGENLTFLAPDADTSLTFDAVLHESKCSTWVHAVVLASTFNDADTLDAALGFQKLTTLDETYSTLEEPRAAVYRALFGDAEDVDEVLQSALLSTDPTGMYSGLAEYAMVRLLPEYRLIEAILGGNQTEFDNAVVAVHEAHVQWYSAVSEEGEPRYGNIEVLVNWELSGLVALALRRGFSAPPQSPYMFTAAPTPEGVEQ